MGCDSFLNSAVCRYRRVLILGLTPAVLALIPILAADDFKAQSKSIYVVLLMAVFWTTEVLPLAVTAFIPAVLFPLMGMMKASAVAPLYMKELNMLFVGGLMVAVAVEHWNLHKRIALRFLLVVGAKPQWMLMGFMLPTWFLSMWISNTATTAMMVPIAQAVIEQLGINKKDDVDVPAAAADGTDAENNEKETILDLNAIEARQRERGTEAWDNEQLSSPDVRMYEEIPPNGSQPVKLTKFNKARVAPVVSDSPVEIEKVVGSVAGVATAMNLCICYAASVGGISTLTGTGPNLLLKAETDEIWEKYGKESQVTFGSWMLFALPASLICLVIGWIWLIIVFIGLRIFREKMEPRRAEKIRVMLQNDYDALGPLSFAEIAMIASFSALGVLWFTRDPGIFPGWAQIFPHSKYIKDSTVAITVAVFLFIIPSKNPFRSSGEDIKPLLDWHTASTKLPWGVMWLLGGGFALATNVKESGLSDWIAIGLEDALGSMNRVLMIVVLCFIVATMTEFTSNTAAATMLIAILTTTAQRMDVNPLYLLCPAIMSCSFAFMLPAATPPNAIVFAYNQVTVAQMMKAGIGMNIFCVLVSTLAITTWGRAIFDMESMPWDGVTEPTPTDSPLQCVYNATMNVCQFSG